MLRQLGQGGCGIILALLIVVRELVQRPYRVFAVLLIPLAVFYVLVYVAPFQFQLHRDIQKAALLLAMICTYACAHFLLLTRWPKRLPLFLYPIALVIISMIFVVVFVLLLKSSLQ